VVLLLTAGATVACGGGRATVDRKQEEAALRAADLAWSEVARRKDLDGIVSYMADDGETLAPNEPAAEIGSSVAVGATGSAPAEHRRQASGSRV
jgi:hypothetical protein